MNISCTLRLCQMNYVIQDGPGDLPDGKKIFATIKICPNCGRTYQKVWDDSEKKNYLQQHGLEFTLL